jgi:PEP-CTERM motif
MRHTFRIAAIVLATALVLSVSSSRFADAAELTVEGYTNGCFGSCTPTPGSAPQTATTFGLTFANSTINGTTTAGTLFLNAPSTHPSQGMNNLGSFGVSNPPARSYSGPFTLLTTFTVPGTTPGADTFAATLSGTIGFGDNPDEGAGFVTIDFDNSPHSFAVNGGGSFTLTITGDLVIPANADAPIVGTIQFTEGPNTPTTPVPEPTTLVLVGGAGLVGVVRSVRARRRQRPCEGEACTVPVESMDSRTHSDRVQPLSS